MPPSFLTYWSFSQICLVCQDKDNTLTLWQVLTAVADARAPLVGHTGCDKGPGLVYSYRHGLSCGDLKEKQRRTNCKNSVLRVRTIGLKPVS